MPHPAHPDPLEVLLGLARWPGDGGPVYTESDFSQTLVEPMNTWSAALFLLLALWWLRRLAPVRREHPLLKNIVPLLAIGGLGGTLYHAFRVSPVFLAMDWMPIPILTIWAAIYFLRRQVGSAKKAVLWLVPVFVAFSLNGILMRSENSPVPRDWAINVGYSLMGLMVLVPILRYLWLRRWQQVGLLVAALASFGLAVFFRSIDGWQPPLFSFGTHWLWHVFGALATGLMLELVFRLKPAALPVPLRRPVRVA